jgi:hypothetical protein
MALFDKKISIDISGMHDNFGNIELGGIDICGGGHIFMSTLGMMTFDMCNAELPKLDISSHGIDLCGNDQMHIQSDFIEISGNTHTTKIENNSIKIGHAFAITSDNNRLLINMD